MKLSDLDKSQYQFTEIATQGKDSLSSPVPGVGSLSRMGLGLGTEIGKAGLGLGELAVKGLQYGASKISPSLAKGFEPQISAIKETKKNVFEKPFEKELNTGSAKVGKFLGQAAPFVAGTPAITRGQGILANILQPISKVKGLGTATKAISQAVPEALGTGATQLAISGGNVESAKEASLYSGVGSGALSTLGSLGRATFFPELKTSVTRALGLQGKTTGGMVEPIIEKKIAGLSVLNKYAPDIKVKDADGFEKAFVPSKATFDETLQAWNTARKAVFKKYHEISTNLGKSDFVDKSGQLVPTGIDVTSVADDLNNIINSPRTSPYKDAARSILKDLVDNFGEIKNGKVLFKKVTPDTIETFLSDLYVPASSVFQGKGDRAYAEIAAGASKGVRNLLDNAIESAGGTEYSGLRSEYSALKAIEDDLVRRFQQEARQLGGGLSDYASIFSSGDLIAGFLSANPSLIAKGASQNFLFSLFKALKRPNRYLQRSFQLLNKTDGGDLASRMFGGVGGRALSESDQKLVDTIKNYAKNPKLGMSIEDVSSQGDNLLSEARKYKSAEEFVNSFERQFHGSPRADLQEIGFGTGVRSNPFMGTSKEVKSPAIFFTKDKGVAEKFARNRVEYLATKGEKGVPTVYERFINKKDVIDLTKPEKIDKVFDKLGISAERELLGLEPNYGLGDNFSLLLETGQVELGDLFQVFDDPKLVKKFKDAGISGVRLVEKGNLGESVAVFDPKKALSKSQLTDIWKKANQPQAYQGESDLTTKFLEYAKGKTTLSRQEILDFARRPELKKGEADLLLKKLEEFEPKVDALSQEARKYKSAEEFVKAQQPTTKKLQFGEQNIAIKDLHAHGEPELRDAIRNVKNGATSRSTGMVEATQLPNGKIVVLDGQHRVIQAMNEGRGAIKVEIIPYKEAIEPEFGYTVRNLIKDGEPVPFQTKSQLTDIWNKAQGTSKLPAQDFADSIRRDLLELKPVKSKTFGRYKDGMPKLTREGFDTQYDNVTIDKRMNGGGRANSINYEEVVFESPITTNGSSHFPNSKNYFAHARGDEVVEGGKKIWREQEIQSDLLQKDNLENLKKFAQRPKTVYPNQEFTPIKEVNKLDPFTNDRFGERIMRERIREKASKGYSKYRLPTGETIGKIEGFETGNWFNADGKYEAITPQNVRVGMTINNTPEFTNSSEEFVVTEVLKDGRIKAIQKDAISGMEDELRTFGSSPDDAIEALRNGNKEAKEIMESAYEAEIFDLTGKSNPQYRRYESWNKFLINKYGAKRVVDGQGNSWVEVDLKKEMGKLPVEAFGVAGLLGIDKENE